MSSPSSPYKEVGLAGQDVADQRRQPRRRKLYGPGVGSSPEQMKARILGHRWETIFGAKVKTANKAVKRRAQTQRCTRCGIPKFAVDGLPCKPRRK